MSRDGGVEQLFLSMAIARRMLPIAFAIIGLRRSARKTGEALETVFSSAHQIVVRNRQRLADMDA
jgi:hypothetical protein